MPIARKQIRSLHQWTNWEVMFSTQSVQQLHDTTIEGLLGVVFSVWSMPRCYKQDKFRV
jgi:hypothetical protein